MKVLILSCNTGEGHNSAGCAVREALLAQGAECDMADYLQFGLPGTARVIPRGHSFVYRRLPHLFGAAYRLAEQHDPSRGRSAVYRINCGKIAERLYDFICSGGYDAVVCTHVFAADAATRLREKYGAEWKLYFVATDYTCSPGVGDVMADACFTPHKALSDEFIAAGIDAASIVPSGIPVRNAFLHRVPMAEAREKLELSPQSRSILLMGGSMGVGPFAQLVHRLSQKLPEDGDLIVICGRNTHLQRQLAAQNLPRVRIVGYTDQVPLYMDASELLLTKAGGLSSTEALMKRLPIVYLDAVPGCETRNRDFLCGLDCAITADGIEQLSDAAIQLFSDPARLAGMQAHIPVCFSQNAATEIASRVLRAE